MTSWIAHYWWLAPLVIVAGAIPLSRYLERKRRETYEAFCLTRGFTFEVARPGGEVHYAAVCPLFAKGHARTWGYTLGGRWSSRPFTAFEYRYTTGGGKNSHTHWLAMILWEDAEATLPRFSVTPEGFWDRLAQRFGRQDFDFVEDAEFSAAYQLQGDDEAAIRRLFAPDVRRRLVATPGQHAAAGGRHLLWWRVGKLPKPDDLDTFFAEGDGIRQLFVER